MSKGIKTTDSLVRFTKDPIRFVEQLRRSGQPLLLTLDDESGVVVQDAAAYEELRQMADRCETVQAVKESLRDMAAGRTRPIREALAELATKHKLPHRRGK